MRDLTVEEKNIVSANQAAGYRYRSQHTSTKPLPYRKLPGHVLVEEFLAPAFPMSLAHLSSRTRIPLDRLHKLIRGQDRIDDFIADRLGRFFRNGSKYWLDLQKKYEQGTAL
jgi:plasmid maintenance system antidote protein VapI